MLKKVNEPMERKLEGIRIADADFPAPFVSGLEYAPQLKKKRPIVPGTKYLPTSKNHNKPMLIIETYRNFLINL